MSVNFCGRSLQLIKIEKKKCINPHCFMDVELKTMETRTEQSRVCVSCNIRKRAGQRKRIYYIRQQVCSCFIIAGRFAFEKKNRKAAPCLPFKIKVYRYAIYLVKQILAIRTFGQ